MIRSSPCSNDNVPDNNDNDHYIIDIMVSQIVIPVDISSRLTQNDQSHNIYILNRKIFSNEECVKNITFSLFVWT